MEDLTKLLWLLLAIPVVFLLVRPIAGYRAIRYTIICFHAIILTFLTVFVFNRPGWKWSRSADALNLLGNTNDSRAYTFLNNNFILIDNSFDKSLMLYPQGNDDDSTRLVITNRNTLVSFLDLLKKNQTLVDLVVLDIGIDKDSDPDSALSSRLMQLYNENKLLLSLNPYDRAAFHPINDPSAYGNIAEKGDDKLFVTHQINASNVYSLPYKIYGYFKKIDKAKPVIGNLFREYGPAKTRHLANNIFAPAFSMTDEQRIIGKSRRQTHLVQGGADKGTETSSHIYYLMSQTLSPTGSAAFISNLQYRASIGQHNIIFIGSFDSPDEDKHQTMYGILHGPTIILNTVYALQRGEHFLNGWYILILLLGFLAISFYMVNHALRPYYSAEGSPAQKQGSAAKFITRVRGGLENIRKFFDPFVAHSQRWIVFNLLRSVIGYVLSEQLLFLMLFAIILLEKGITHRVPNILVLLFYFSILKSSLGYAAKTMKAKHAADPPRGSRPRRNKKNTG